MAYETKNTASYNYQGKGSVDSIYELLMESGSKLLLETGDNILLEFTGANLAYTYVTKN